MSKLLARRILESKGIEIPERLREADAYTEYRKRMLNHPTNKKIAALCEKYGYKLGESIAPTEKNGEKSITLRIIEDRATYHPTIYFNHKKFGVLKNTFEIQTTAVGALELEEYAKYLKGCQDAHDLVAELSKIDLTTMYDPTVDYPKWHEY